MTNEPKLEEIYPNYPCTKCDTWNSDRCSEYEDCVKYRRWFRKAWREYRLYSQRFREEQERRKNAEKVITYRSWRTQKVRAQKGLQ